MSSWHQHDYHDHHTRDFNNSASSLMNECENRLAPSAAQVYGYGFLATIVVCLVSLVALALFPLIPSRFRDDFNGFMSSAAVGALTGDALLHMIPTALGFHSHGHDNDCTHSQRDLADEVSKTNVLFKLMAVVGGLYLFYILDILVTRFSPHCHVHVEMPETLSAPIGRRHTIPDLHDITCNCDEEQSKFEAGPLGKNKQIYARLKSALTSIRGIHSYALSLMVADTLHNFVDGFTMGAAFSSSIELGLSTTIAIILHELPHEIGDFAVLLKSGLSKRQAVFLNLVTGLTSILGFFVGAILGTKTEQSLPWILAVCSGIFLYVALTDILPTVIPTSETCRNKKTSFLYIVGITGGFALMFLVAYYEDAIHSLIS